MESIGIGLVIVSHSKHIAEGVVELISKVAKDVPIYFNRSETIVFLNCESIKTDCDGAILALETFKN